MPSLESDCLNKPELRLLFKPEIKDPIFVGGLPGFGEIGRLSARLLIEFVGAKKFAELYSPYFPDYVIIDNAGICRLPRYEFYGCTECKPHLVILTGDAQPGPEDINAHYELCRIVLDFAKKLGCKKFVTFGGFPTPVGADAVYIAATSKKLASSIAAKGGGTIYSGGKIVGAAGLLLGLAKSQGFSGVCVLGATQGQVPDRRAALLVFRYFTQAFKLKRAEA